MMYDNDREGDLKDLDSMVKCRQETHKKGEIQKFRNFMVNLDK